MKKLISSLIYFFLTVIIYGMDNTQEVNIYITPQERFIQAAKNGDRATLAYLLEYHAQDIAINAPDSENGLTAFTHAAINNHVDVMQLLIDYGYDLTIKDNSNRSGYMHLFAFDNFVSYINQHNCLHDLIQQQGADIFVYASQKGAFKHFLSLLRYGISPFTTFNSEGLTALHGAAQGNQKAIARLLLEKYKIKPTLPSKDMRCPHHIAALYGSREVFDYLIQFLTLEELYYAELKYGTILHNAIVGDHPTMVTYLINEFPFLLTIKNNFDMSPLGIAVLYNREDIVHLLIDQFNVNPYEDEYDGIPLIHVAAAKGYRNLVQYFIETVGMDPLIENTKYKNALYYAAAYGRLEVLRYFLEELSYDPFLTTQTTGETLLQAAMIVSDLPDIIHYLIQQHNLDSNMPDKNGNTPLAYAAYNGRYASMRVLVERHKAKIDTTDNQLTTPLMHAIARNHVSIARYLIEHAGADIHHRDMNGNSVVHLAGKHEAMLSYILSQRNKKIDINVKNNVHNTPLHIVAYDVQGNKQVKMLLQAGAQPNSTNMYNLTPFHYAANNSIHALLKQFSKYRSKLFKAYYQKSLIKLAYLARKITCNIQNHNGDTLLHLAITASQEDTKNYEQYVKIAQFLLTLNQELASVKNNQGITPVYQTVIQHELTMLKLLTQAACAQKDTNTLLP